MPGARCTRSLVCAIVVSMHTSIHSEPSENTRHSRTQWFTAYTALSPVIGFLATVACGVASTDLTPASGCQDHTPSPSASASFVRTLIARMMPPRPSHPAPNVRDDREAPLLWEQDGNGYSSDLGLLKIRIFLQKGLDRGQVICPSGRLWAHLFAPVPIRQELISRNDQSVSISRTSASVGP